MMGVMHKNASTVLVVEDEPLMRMQVAMELSVVGFRVLETATADHALTVLESGQPIDVLFTDVHMPGEHNGLSLAGVTLARWPHIGVLVTSGVFQPEVPTPARFVAKPYDMAEVVLEIKRLLGSFRI
jgi:two-component system, response regulator PdtaR